MSPARHSTTTISHWTGGWSSRVGVLIGLAVALVCSPLWGRPQSSQEAVVVDLERGECQPAEAALSECRHELATLCESSGGTDPDSLPEPELCTASGPAGDEIWLVNTRDLEMEACDGGVAAELPVSRWNGNQFCPASLSELLARANSSPEFQNVTYIHGNFTDFSWSVRRGLQVYSSCFSRSSDRPPIRFIIWSWRSERETLLGRDYLIKSQRAVAEGARLNSLVSQLGPDPPVVIGYSLGAQATLAALSQPAGADQPPWVVTLIAAALDPQFCGTLENNAAIAGRLQRLVLFTNQNDPALNCSLRITRRSTANPHPAGQYSILPNLRGGPALLEQYEVSREVGRHHAISQYLDSPTVLSHLKSLVRD